MGSHIFCNRDLHYALKRVSPFVDPQVEKSMNFTKKAWEYHADFHIGLIELELARVHETLFGKICVYTFESSAGRSISDPYHMKHTFGDCSISHDMLLRHGLDVARYRNKILLQTRFYSGK